MAEVLIGGPCLKIVGRRSSWVDLHLQLLEHVLGLGYVIISVHVVQLVDFRRVQASCLLSFRLWRG